MFRTHHIGGFTLIELLASTTVLAIGLVVAIPTFERLRANAQLTASGNALLADLTFARTHALQSSVQTIVCPTEDGLSLIHI